jgi:NAD(P)-dependent dehydrogenase (short-subunit alcohol dehydrogenase family)
MKFINKLEGKRILIFGSTSGIGYAVAEASVEYGATIIVSGSNQERLDKTVQRLKDSYPNLTHERITTVVCNLSDEVNLDTNVKEALSKATNDGKDKLDHIAFTAGDSLYPSKISEVTLDIVRKAQTVRLLAPVMIGKYICDYIKVSPDSSFTITGGVNTDKPSPSWSIIAAAGGAGAGLARGFAIDLAPVRVNTVSPGAIMTELLKKNFTTEQATYWAEQKTTTKRLGRPEDTAEAYLYCMKDGFVTGEVISTNGGYLLL